MFDTHIHKHGGGSQHHTHNVTVKEVRAPTDASVKLLREMEDKALGEVVKKSVVGDNGFTASIHSMVKAETQANVLRAVYSLNGKVMTTTVEMQKFEQVQQEPGALERKLRDEMAKDIATELLEVAFVKQGYTFK